MQEEELRLRTLPALGNSLCALKEAELTAPLSHEAPSLPLGHCLPHCHYQLQTGLSPGFQTTVTWQGHQNLPKPHTHSETELGRCFQMFNFPSPPFAGCYPDTVEARSLGYPPLLVCGNTSCLILTKPPGILAYFILKPRVYVPSLPLLPSSLAFSLELRS